MLEYPKNNVCLTARWNALFFGGQPLFCPPWRSLRRKGGMLMETAALIFSILGVVIGAAKLAIEIVKLIKANKKEPTATTPIKMVDSFY